MAAVKALFLKTFNRLNENELEEFKRLLQQIFCQEDFSEIQPWSVTEIKSNTDLVDVMVEELGPTSRKIFMDMNRSDLIKMLPETRSAIKGEERSNTTSGCLFIVTYLELQTSPSSGFAVKQMKMWPLGSVCFYSTYSIDSPAEPLVVCHKRNSGAENLPLWYTTTSCDSKSIKTNN